MKPKSYLHHTKYRTGAVCAFLLSTTLFIPLSYAQAPAESDVFELTPFEVSADSEVGYLATQTLSGTRMRSELGDVAASIDVLTEEFLRDVGATNMYEALDYVGNVETWGKSGGISDNENQVWFSNPYMARGFVTSTQTSDFFDMGGKVPMDFFSKSNFTVARGPNAILFGIGSPGGIVNATRKRPQWGKDMAEVQVRVDEYGSVRATLDFSKEIVDNRLAVRGAILKDDAKEFLEPAGYDREAFYGAVAFRPFRKTSILVTAEDGSEHRIFQYTSINYDGVTNWINAGKPTYSGVNNVPPINGNFGSGLDRTNNYSSVFVSGQPEIPIMNWRYMAQTERFEIWTDRNGDGVLQVHPDVNQIRSTGFTEETAIWDYEDIQIHGKSRERELDWRDISIFLTQEVFVPELQVELAYNRVDTEYLLAHTFGQFFLEMDVNQLLPNGSPNPNFGVPFVQSGRSQVTAEINKAETARATVSYDLDLNDHKIFGMGLGRYNLLGLYEERRQNTLFAEFYHVFSPNVAGVPNPGLLHGNNQVQTRTYLDTYLTPEGANVQPYFTPDYTAIDRDGAKSEWARNSSPRDIDDKRLSYVLALQAYLWPTKDNYDRIILTAGYRKDRETSQRLEYQREGLKRGNDPYEGARWFGSPWNLDAAGREAFWDGTFNYGTLGEPSLTESPTKTYSAIFKLTKDLSVFYNYSDVLISASSLFTDIYDNFVDGTVGETDDFGVRWTALNGKLVTSLTFFETTAQNQRESNVRNNFKPEMELIWAEIPSPDSDVFTGFNDRFVTLRNDTSEGMEFSATANLAPGWSTRLSISQIETIITSRLPFVDKYIAEFSPIWEKYRDQDLPTSTEFATIGDALDEIYSEIADLHALEGTVPQAQREWKVVFNTNYRFQDGALEGWGLGGGVRWQSSDTIGYAYDENYVVDPNKPFKGEDIMDVTGQVFYQTTIKGVWMRFQLNVTNLLDEDGMFPRSAVDDLTGNPYYGRQQVRQPRSFFFTTTFKF
ncbi:MAG TPA: TonB-dependent receptor plug domain-containing protein [Oceanipulchritudo sp.]|nr:TonB-dependent receptor plug domain-containing protein [Oceanipulchritudo sp.]